MALLQNDVRNHDLALVIADDLRGRFPEVWPHGLSRRYPRPPRAVHAPRMLDVNYSTPELGVGFCISLKPGSLMHGWKEPTARMGQVDEELRTEARGYHQRQPFAVMIAVVFLPADACLDASDRDSSSFGAWVRYLRPVAGRHDVGDDIARFERVFIGLYERDGSTMEFFDVEQAPPKKGRPESLLSYLGFLDEIERAFLQRNAAEFKWADDDSTEDDEPPED